MSYRARLKDIDINKVPGYIIYTLWVRFLHSTTFLQHETNIKHVVTESFQFFSPIFLSWKMCIYNF